MTVDKIPNINNCRVDPLGNPVIGYTITANEGWCIHTANHDENSYIKAILIPISFDMSTIQILEIATLPEGS